MIDIDLQRLLEMLRNRNEDRGYLADLRCALVKSRRYRAWPHLARFNGVGDGYKARLVQTIAGLYAYPPLEAVEKNNLGDMCFALLSDEERQELNQEKSRPGPMAKRLQYILASTGEEIFDRIVRLVLYAKSKGVTVNYEQLADDLRNWQNGSDRVKSEWAKSFWAHSSDHHSAEEKK